MVYKVIQWATGECGVEAVKGILRADHLELVGTRVFNPEKVGRDVGEICGVGPIGIAAIDDEDALLSLEADCVLWMAEASMFSLDSEIDAGTEGLCRILRSGKNIISIVHTHCIYPPGMPPALRDEIEAACHEGGVSFMATGIDPGFNLEVMGLVTSSLSRRIDRLKAMEVMNYGPHMNRQIIFDVMGFGRAPSEQVQNKFIEMMTYAYLPSLNLVVDAMGAEMEKFSRFIDTRTASRDIEVGSGVIAKGTVSAMKFGFHAYVDGEPRVTLEHTTRMHEDEAPDWPTGHGYYIHIDGEPPIRVELLLGEKGDQTEDYYQSCQHVAVPMRAVNAVPALCDAPPGIRTMIELPQPRGIGVLAGDR